MWRTKFCTAYSKVIKACVFYDYSTYKTSSIMSISSGKFTAH